MEESFSIIWSGQFFSILTSSLVNFAIIIWISLQTGSAEMLAWAAIAALLPQTVIGPFTGALIVSVLFPLMTLEYFNGTEFQAGIMEALWSEGALAGCTIMGAKVYKINRVALINWMYLVCGLTFLLTGLLSPGGFVWFAVLTAIGGVSGAMYNAAFTGLLQTKIEPGALGRAFSMFFTFSFIPAMLGLIGIGFVADGLGLTTSFVLSGIIIFLIGVAAFLTPVAMRLDRQN